MKKVTLCILAILMIISVLSVTLISSSAEEILYGDVNGDGKITISDLTLLKNYFANYDYGTGTSTVILGKTVKVTWKNYDGTVLQSGKVKYGTIPTYNGETPIKEIDDGNEYTFTGWDKTVEAVTEDTEYIAQYSDNSGYSVSFDVPANVEIITYKTQGLTDGTTYSKPVYAGNSNTGIPAMDGSDQINFKVVVPEGKMVDTITIEGTYKNLKGPIDTEVENVYRVTKIESDLTITVTVKDITVVEDGYNVTFDIPNGVEVTVYKTQELTDGVKYTDSVLARNSDTGIANKDGNDQVNFSIELPEEYQVDKITVEGGYKNIKGPEDTEADNTYRITKVTSDIIIKITIMNSKAEAPEFSAESGFYDEEFDLVLTAEENCNIYYTLDGSDPTVENGILYEGAIRVYDCTSNPNVYSARTDISINSVTAPNYSVDKIMIVRAVAVNKKGSVSDIVTKSYFVDYTSGNKAYYQNALVISLTTDPDNLFGSEKGIYILGDTYQQWLDSEDYDPSITGHHVPTNYGQSGKEWERKTTMQVFDTGKLVLSQDVGIRIHGNASVTLTQKSFNIYARSEYGNSHMDYAFFGEDGPSSFHDLTIATTMISKPIDVWVSAVTEDLNFETADMRPCLVFIDGEFWGQYTICERYKSEYIEDHYDIPKDDVVIIKNSSLEEGTDQDKANDSEFLSWVKSTDFSIQSNYEEFCSYVDIESLLDYYATEVFLGNADWPTNNIERWRSRDVIDGNPYADGKWRFMLYDVDNGGRSQYDSLINALKQDIFIPYIIKNEEFKSQFIDRIMKIGNIVFNKERVSDICSMLNDEYHVNGNSLTHNRFGSGYVSFYFGNSVTDFLADRCKTVASQIIADLSLSDTICRIDIVGTKGLNETLTINGDNLYSENDWTGYYISSNEVVISYIGEYFKNYTVVYDGGEPITITDSTFTVDTTAGTVTIVLNESYLEESGYTVSFDVPADVEIITYKTQGLTDGTTYSKPVYAGNSNTGIPAMDGSDQINFKVVVPEGKMVDTITIEGTYKNLKGPSDTEVENVYRVTKIESDLTITVTVKDIPVVEDGYNVTFDIPNGVEVTVYKTQELTDGVKYTDSVLARNSDTGIANKDGSDQVNFKVVVPSGYEIDEIVANGSFKNLKGPGDTGVDNTYRITKVSSDLTVTIKIKAIETEIHDAIVINEVLTYNENGVTNLAGEKCAWIELYNKSENDIDIGGYGLTYAKLNQYMVTFKKNTIIPSKGYLLVLCGTDKTFSNSEVYVKIDLLKSGETLYLTTPNGYAESTITIPSLLCDVSFGLSKDGTIYQKMEPTPLEENGEEWVNNHTLLQTDTVEATLVDEGQIIYYCEHCSKELIEYTPKIDPLSLNIPVVYIDGEISGITKTVLGTVGVRYFSEDKEFECYATLKVQGSLSASFPKKNYTIKLYKDSDLSKSQKEDLGWGKESKYCLKANYIDFSESRNIVSANIWSDIVASRTDVNSELLETPNNGAVDGYPVLMYLNNEFYGIYTMNIPKDSWLFAMDGDDTTKQAIIMGSDWTDSTFFKKEISDYSNITADGWEMEYCSTNDETWAVESFNNLINFVINNDGEDFKNGISNYLDVNSMIDTIIYTYVIKASDNYAKNTMFVTYDGIHWIASMYDMDGTWGIYWDGSVTSSTSFIPNYWKESGKNIVNVKNILWKKIMQEFDDEVKARYFILRENILSNKNIKSEFESFIGLIPEIAFDTEREKWVKVPSNNIDHLDLINTFVDERMEALDTFFNGNW